MHLGRMLPEGWAKSMVCVSMFLVPHGWPHKASLEPFASSGPPSDPSLPPLPSYLSTSAPPATLSLQPPLRSTAPAPLISSPSFSVTSLSCQSFRFLAGGLRSVGAAAGLELIVSSPVEFSGFALLRLLRRLKVGFFCAAA